MANGLRSALKTLFSSNVVVHNVGGDDIKVVDTSNIQSISQDHLGGGGGRPRGGMGGSGAPNVNLGGSGMSGMGVGTGQGAYADSLPRRRLYHDYELMENDAIVHSALDFYADEAVVEDEHGDVLTIETEHQEIEEILHNLYYEVLNIEFNLRSWIRDMAKYGDSFIRLYIDYESGNQMGVYNCDVLSPYHIERVEGDDPSNPFEVKFEYDGPEGQGELGYWEVGHFSMRDSAYAPYGRSCLEGARKVFKRLTMMEDAMLIHRIMRAPERRIFKIDVGNVQSGKVESYMQKIMNELKSQPLIDPETGEYDLEFNLMNMMDDYYMPVRGQNDGTEISTLNSLSWNGIEDIEYLRQKMMSALRVPNAFLGYEQDIEGKATLAQESIKFANLVSQIQKTVANELTKIGIVHLFSQGIRDKRLVDFSLGLTHPSHFVEQQKIDLLESKYSLARDIEEQNIHSTEWVMKNIFNMNNEEIKRERRKKVEDFKREFRREQISREGNDPVKTGQSFGTPGDLAMSGASELESFNEPPEEDVPEEEDDEGYSLSPDSPYDDDTQPSDSDFKTTKGDVTHNYQGGPMAASVVQNRHSELIQESLRESNESGHNQDTMTEEEFDERLSDIDWMQEEHVIKEDF
jgi:hypothetical protein